MTNSSEDITIPQEADKDLISYCLHLADNTLILGHRNSEWCGHGPVLEQDIALTNISLDLIGQARNFYQYAAVLMNTLPGGEVENYIAAGSAFKGKLTEDTLAYFRAPAEYKNLLLCELPNGDWAHTILRQFFFSNYQYLLYQYMRRSSLEQMAAIAEKSLKEVTYHLRWSSEWVIRLGDGTAESRTRMEAAIETLWPYVAELFSPAPYEKKEYGALDALQLRHDWQQKTLEIFKEAGLTMPREENVHTGGKTGTHTEDLTLLLTEMQELPRTHPTAEW